MERFHVTRHLPKMVHMTKPKHSEQPENKYFEFLKMMTSSMQWSSHFRLGICLMTSSIVFSINPS